MGRSSNYKYDKAVRIQYNLAAHLAAVNEENVSREFEPLSSKQLKFLGRRDILGACRCNLTTEIPSIEMLGDLGADDIQLTVSLVCIINAHKKLEVEWAESIGEFDFDVDGYLYFETYDVITALEQMRAAVPPCLDGSLIKLEDVAQVCGIKLKNVLDVVVNPDRRKAFQEMGFAQLRLETEGAEPDPVFWGRELGWLCNYNRRSRGISGIWYKLVVYSTISDLFVCYCTAENRLGGKFRQSRVCRSREEVLSCVRDCDLLPEFEADEQEWLSLLQTYIVP